MLKKHEFALWPAGTMVEVFNEGQWEAAEVEGEVMVDNYVSPRSRQAGKARTRAESHHQALEDADEDHKHPYRVKMEKNGQCIDVSADESYQRIRRLQCKL